MPLARWARKSAAARWSRAHRAGLRRGGCVDRDAGEIFDQRERLVFTRSLTRRAGARDEQLPLAVVDRARHRAAICRKVIEQREEIGQVGQLDAKLIHRQDETRAVSVCAGRFQQPVAVGDALGDALG
jgi:hypothetical protein